jgi:hypothetical protein
MIELWGTRFGVPIGTGPLFRYQTADIVIEELDNFSQHSVVVPATDRQAILSMQPYTLLEIKQENLSVSSNPTQTITSNTIGWGYVLDPEHQISNNDDGTITFTLEPLTVEATWFMTRIGFQAGGDSSINSFISVTAQKIADLIGGDGYTPKWYGRFIADYTADIPFSVTYDNLTALGAFQQFAKDTQYFCRIGTTAGIQDRILEMGEFGVSSGITLASADGAQPDDMDSNKSTRLIASVTHHPNNVSQLVNVVAPYGGGNDRSSLVTLERLWRIINDPSYPGVGQYGSEAESMARTGKSSLFPEYDPAYPITDPSNPPTGTIQYTILDTAGNVVGTNTSGQYAVVIQGLNPDGTRILQVFDSLGHTRPDLIAALSQGAFFTRGVCLDGHYEYDVLDTASYNQWGHKRGAFVDSQFNYTDPSPANQELTERALYVATVANLKKFSQPHHTFTCVVAQATGRPPRAGDLVTVEFNKVGYEETEVGGAAIVEMSVAEDLRVMKVVRHFTEGEPPTDEYTLSNLGRFENESAASAISDMARQLVAVQIKQGTGLAPFFIPWAENVDANNPVIIPFYIVNEKARFHQVRVQCDFSSYRGSSETATNSAATITLSVPHGTHQVAAQPGHSFGGGGIASTNDQIAALQHHYHTIQVVANTGGTPNVKIASSGGAGLLAATSGGASVVSTDKEVNFDTGHGHTTPIQQGVAMQFPDSLTGPLPQHTHPLDQHIPQNQPSPSLIHFAINGQYLSSGVVTTGTRGSGGEFTTSFVIEDIGPQLEQFKAGETVQLKFEAGAGPGNNFGVGYLRIMITGVMELGGLTSIIQSA